MARSWVETTCPPGWSVRVEAPHMWCAYQRDWLRGNAANRDGDVVWCDDEASARRLAWERWALEVLGGRIVWEYGTCCIRYVTALYDDRRDDSDAAWVTIAPGDTGYTVTDPERDPEIVCSDPVEALARLAALTLAVLGPEVTP